MTEFEREKISYMRGKIAAMRECIGVVHDVQDGYEHEIETMFEDADRETFLRVRNYISDENEYIVRAIIMSMGDLRGKYDL